MTCRVLRQELAHHKTGGSVVAQSTFGDGFCVGQEFCSVQYWIPDVDYTDESFAKSYQVILFDTSGHVHTPWISSRRVVVMNRMFIYRPAW